MAKASWYLAVNKSRVIRDLEKYPQLSELLGIYKKTFISWCANQRFMYEEDIFDEVQDFLNNYITKRLYAVDVRLWKRIASQIFSRDGYKCAYCGITGGKLEVDHVVPISKGGSNDLSNLTTACQKCNRQKKDKSVQEFKEWSALR